MYDTDTKSQFLVLSALVRAEIRKVCLVPPLVENAIAAEE
jgi:hypothetical protein